MPGFVKTKEDERLWEKAKSIAEEQGHKEEWDYITGIYKKMKGGKVAAIISDRDIVQNMTGKTIRDVKIADFDGVADITLDDGSMFFVHTPPPGAKSRQADAKTGVHALTRLLAYMEALQRYHWTNHWLAKGDPYYGDHLLFGRLYENIEDEIDGLAEKIVYMIGPDAVDQAVRADLALSYLRSWRGNNPETALGVEQKFQELVKRTIEILDDEGSMTNGMEDFLQALANNHETNLYLLNQRTRTASSRLRTGYDEKIPGGLAKNKKPEDFDEKALAKGIDVEMEHTDDPNVAREIAMDHLTEDENYYEKLETIEKHAIRLANRYIMAHETPDQRIARRFMDRRAAVIKTKSSVYVLSGEQLEKVIKSGDLKAALNNQNYNLADKSIIDVGGLVFHMGSDGSYEVDIQPAK